MLATNGNTRLGGDDLDKRLVDFLRYAAAQRDAKPMRSIVFRPGLRQKHRCHGAQQITDGRIVRSRGRPKA